MLNERVAVAGKYFVADAKKWFIKGFSYGPFAPNSRGEFLPEPGQMLADFRQIRAMEGNCIRVYHPPSRLVLDAACEHDLRVLVDVPWQKHRCFFEDWTARKDALRRAWSTSRRLGNHPGLFAISVGNEIPVDVVRYYGSHRVSRFLDELVDTVKQESPECLTTYVNFPTTEFLTVNSCDFHCFNVYLHDPQNLGDYLDRLQHIAGNAPLVLGEYGVDTIRHGEQHQEELLTHHLRQVSRRGLAGSFIFSFTDEWFTGGHLIEDWTFGVTRRDRTPKPSAAALEDVWRRHPEPLCDAPPVSVIVCSYNGAATLRECLASLMELQYPDYEVILVDDGSTDATEEIAADFPQVVYHRQTNR
jgi:hypothetical protein